MDRPRRKSRKKQIKISPARAVAYDLLRAVLDRSQAFDDALAEHEEMRQLDQRDRGFARLIAATTLRRLGQIDVVLNSFLATPLPRKAAGLRLILRLATAEMLFLEVQPHAAVNSAVDLAENHGFTAHKKLANAVLRRVSVDGPEALAATSAVDNFPVWMATAWRQEFGDELTVELAEALLLEAPLDISVKADPDGWAPRLEAEILAIGSLRRRFDGPITELDGFEEGAWWVQDAAAALPVRLLGDVAGKSVLDICAAPGGKTAQLLSAGAKVTAIDRSPKRLERLQSNLARLDLSAEIVVADAAQWRPEELADAVLLDPPCTATGTIRRHPDIPHLKRGEDLGKLVDLQTRLLTAAGEMVRPGGTLVYCTCSLQGAENAAIVDAFLASGAPFERAPIRAKEVGGHGELLSAEGDLRSLPCHLPEQGGLDGFYAARLVRH